MCQGRLEAESILEPALGTPQAWEESEPGLRERVCEIQEMHEEAIDPLKEMSEEEARAAGDRMKRHC